MSGGVPAPAVLLSRPTAPAERRRAGGNEGNDDADSTARHGNQRHDHARHPVGRRAPAALPLVVPSDPGVADRTASAAALARATVAARGGARATFGIAPARPETGYGYIRRGAALPDQEGCYAVAAFVEKPDRPRAE